MQCAKELQFTSAFIAVFHTTSLGNSLPLLFSSLFFFSVIVVDDDNLSFVLLRLSRNPFHCPSGV